MPLEDYQKKRNFDSTSEPEVESIGTGERSPGKTDPIKSKDMLKFVVHKHFASHLHFDLRLELDGVLKSWAVPKGPSINPKDKKLAVMVEDHPLEYKDFEGIIPEGNYGAGKVYIWDYGTYHALDTDDIQQSSRILREGLEKGHMTFILNGEKLKGEFALIRLKKASPKNWLLIKKNDEFAAEIDISLLAAPGETEEKENSKKKTVKILEKQGISVPSLKKTSKITHFKPMLATLIKKPFDSNEWLFEIKWDGYRAIAEIQKDSVLLYSRNDLNFNSQFPEIVESLKKMQITAVLDGEIVVLDKQGRSQFQLLQQYFKYKKGILVYYVFDILCFEGYELLGLPLITRKKLLNQILSSSPGNSSSTVPDLNAGTGRTPGSSIKNIKISGHIEKEGIAFFNEAVKNGLEGIMAKKSDSIYIPGSRSSKWLKIKAKMRQEVVIAGYTEPRGSRNKIGSIITGLYDKGVLVFAGQAGSGFDEKELENLYNVFKKLETGICPFKTVPNTTTTAHWIKPQLVAEVEFAEWTDKNVMRHPVFIGLRTDKDVLDVKIEKPVILKIDNLVILTHPDKIFWPEEKYTKKDLFEYYKNISEYILPYILNKPHSLNRCPDGIEGECFYQKDIDYNLPPWLYTRKIFAESKNEYIDYLVCTGTDSLLYMVNLGCIDIHPWNSTVDRLEYPDYAILDLDPLDVDFSDVVIIAKEAKRVLEGIDVEGFCKTSGSKGIHIYIPLGAKYTYEQALDFVKIIAKLINMRQPDLTSLERSPDKRHKKVYLDCYQNRIGQTVVAPYCIRPRKGAPVSTPLQWKELDKNFRPADFNIKNIFHRLDRIGDIWKEVLGTGIDLEKCLEKLKSLI